VSEHRNLLFVYTRGTGNFGGKTNQNYSTYSGATIDPEREPGSYTHWTAGEVAAVARARAAAQTAIVDAQLREITADPVPSRKGRRHPSPQSPPPPASSSSSLLPMLDAPAVPPALKARLIRIVHQVLGQGRSPGPVLFRGAADDEE
jgi:hypothetical protein